MNINALKLYGHPRETDRISTSCKSIRLSDRTLLVHYTNQSSGWTTVAYQKTRSIERRGEDGEWHDCCLNGFNPKLDHDASEG